MLQRLFACCRTYSENPLPVCSRREVRAYRVGRTTLAALKGLFPGMDEKARPHCCIWPREKVPSSMHYWLRLDTAFFLTCGWFGTSLFH